MRLYMAIYPTRRTSQVMRIIETRWGSRANKIIHQSIDQRISFIYLATGPLSLLYQSFELRFHAILMN